MNVLARIHVNNLAYKTAAAFAILLLLGCGDNGFGNSVSEIASCSDGVLNGDETGIDCGGNCSDFCPEPNDLEGDVITRMVLDASVEYRLTGRLLIRDSGSLEIPPGTVIKAVPNVGAYIAVAQGGQLFVFGNEAQPITFTSAAENPAPGDWGGLVFCGKAPLNTEIPSRSAIGDLLYGGDDPENSSGYVKYLRVGYAGAIIDNDIPSGGVSFYGTGKFTLVEYIQSFKSLGANFNFIGGTVSPKWLLADYASTNSISITDGWQGEASFWKASNFTENGIEISNNNTNPLATPTTEISLMNSSLLGPNEGAALALTNGGGLVSIESMYTSQMSIGIGVYDAASSDKITASQVDLEAIEFANTTQNFTTTNYTGPNTSFITEGTTLGAGNRGDAPAWAQNWSIEF